VKLFLITRILVLGSLALSAVPALCGQAIWRKLPFREPEAIHGLCARGDSVWEAADGVVRASGDGGATWSESGSGLQLGKVAGVAAGRRRLAACQGRMLYISADGGQSWLPRDSLETGNFLRMDAWSDTLFAWHAVFAGQTPAGIRFSTDDGLTWNALAFATTPMARARIFGADTFSFSGNTLYRVNSDGPKEMSSLKGSIQELAAGATELFAVADSVIYKASDPKGPWTRLITRYVPGLIFRGVAADSGCIAVQTPMGISLSRNYGEDWEFLRGNFAKLSEQSVHLGNGALYVRRGYSDSVPRRYGFADGKWDSLTRPASVHFIPRMFATQGDRIAYLATTSSSYDSIYRSPDRGAHFQYTGASPQRAINSPKLVLGRGSRLALISNQYYWYSKNDGAGWETVPKGPCLFPNLTVHAALNDSGLFYYTYGFLGRISVDVGECRGASSISLPDGYLREEPATQQGGSCLAAWGGSLYLGWSQGLWVWEETPFTPLAAKSRAIRRASVKMRYPVQVWSPEGSAGSEAARNSIDARGAVRR
jgi:hypothetical protein